VPPFALRLERAFRAAACPSFGGSKSVKLPRIPPVVIQVRAAKHGRRAGTWRPHSNLPRWETSMAEYNEELGLVTYSFGVQI